MKQLWQRIDLEWKILLLALILLLSLGIAMQRLASDRLQETFQESVDPSLDSLLQQGALHVADSSRSVWIGSLERNRQWKAVMPLLMDEQRRTLLSFSLGLVIIFTLFALFTFRYLTRPLRDLRQNAEAIGRGALPDVRVTLGGSIGKLQQEMRTMVEELRHLRERLVEQGMEMAWRDIARIMAHEIKNPLTPIRLTLDRMDERADKGQEIDKEEQKKFLLRISKEVDQLERLTTSLSTFARDPEVRMRPIELADYLKSLAADMIELIPLFVEGKGRIQGDPMLLRQVFLNLIKNGAEAEATEIIIRIEKKQKEQVEVTLSDNGLGLENEKLQQIFLPYVSYKKGGTGLGLAVVKRLLLSMKAAIRAENRFDDKKGLLFTLTFPASKEASQ
ncbi:MAG: hypothetical protein A2293_11845 [Elusimicrobia bacterium RIFOXYB2_FULL_49_7]|nr:MAG: hypothetical protein A2293_11845 [Elusimicrobia bacterium RIFOXYB2_FULL_49_7]